MAWETRGNSQYFYKSERVGGRVRKRYIGPGEMAAIIDSMNEEKRARREAERAKFRSCVEDLTRLERMLEPLEAFAREVIEGVFTATGYHRIKRGPWRKRRVQNESRKQADGSDPARAGRDPGPAPGVFEGDATPGPAG